MVSDFFTGQHSKIKVKHVPFFCMAAAKGPVQKPVNAAELASAARCYANVKVGV